MNDLDRLYKKLSQINYKDLYKIESDFFLNLYNNILSEKRLSCINAFITISNWFGTSQRSGVWTFYEGADTQEIINTLKYLREHEEYELSAILEKGIHDYQNPKYTQNYEYPEEWIEESEEIDDWILKHEDYLWQWEYNLLTENKDNICMCKISNGSRNCDEI